MEISLGGTEIRLSRLGALGVAVSLLFVGYAGYDYLGQSQAIEEAEPVEATVLDIEIEEDSSARGVKYDPRVEYEYSYDGTIYTGEEVFPGSLSPTYNERSEARAITEQYEKGEATTAYINPENPERSFLRDRVTNTPLWLGGIAGLVATLILLNGSGIKNPGRTTQLDSTTSVEYERHSTIFGVGRDKFHRYTRGVIGASAVSLFLSLVVFLLVVLGTSGLDGEESSIEADLFSLVGAPLVVASVSYLLLTASVLSYLIWSFTQYRRLRDRISGTVPPSPFRYPSRLVTILGTDGKDLDEYGKRTKMTATAALVFVLLIGVLVSVVR